MAYLTKAAINAVDDRRTEDFHVEEWGGDICLKVMSGSDLDKFERLLSDPDKAADGGVRARMIALCMVDEKGKPVYSAAEAYELGKKNGGVLTKIFKKCIEMNKIEPDEVEKEVENFEETPDDSSTTD